jgi:hypothetical protein
MRTLFEPVRYYLLAEAAILLVIALIVFLVDTGSKLDVYITRWRPECTAGDNCKRYPEIDFLFELREGSFVGSIAASKAVFILLELLLSDGPATLFHYLGYAVWNTMSIVVVAEVCGLRAGLQIFMSVIYGFAMESMGANHDYVVHRGLVIGNSEIFFILTTIMISLGVSVALISLVKETIESDRWLTYPTLVVIAATIYGVANRSAKYYFYYRLVPREFQVVKDLKKDTKQIPNVRRYLYLTENDPSTIVRWEMYIRGIQFVWILALSIIHLAASDQAINYVFT